MGEVGLSSAAGAKEPSKSFEYTVENRSLDARDPGRGKTFVEPLCLSLIALADLTLSCASFTASCLSTLVSVGCVGVNRALADLTLRGLAELELIFWHSYSEMSGSLYPPFRLIKCLNMARTPCKSIGLVRGCARRAPRTLFSDTRFSGETRTFGRITAQNAGCKVP